MSHRAYSLFEIKSVNEEQRTIEGIATTPKVDRMGDIVSPLGVTAAREIPLLLFHDSRMPVGTVRLGKATKDGIPFTAVIPTIAEEGNLKDRVDEAWQSVKYRLIAAVSIGFRILDDAVERIDTGLKFLKTEVLELSLVPIPAQDEAVITSFKAFCVGDAGPEAINEIRSIDTEQLASTGKTLTDEVDLTGAKLIPAIKAKTVHVAKLSPPALHRADPFVIKRINHLR